VQSFWQLRKDDPRRDLRRPFPTRQLFVLRW